MTPMIPMTAHREPTFGTRRRVGRAAAGLGALLAGLGLGLPPGRPAYAAGALDWHLVRNGPAGEQLRSGLGLRLVNVTVGDVPVYGERSHGINLVWQDAGSQENVRFYRAGGGTVHYGDRVALYVAGGGYVRYGERSHGINLVWSSGPVYEWELFGGTYGAPVVTGTPYFHGLRNTVIQRAVVYGERDEGINLVWFNA